MTRYRARYMEGELVAEGSALVKLRLDDGEEIVMATESFHSLYVPIYTTEVIMDEAVG